MASDFKQQLLVAAAVVALVQHDPLPGQQHSPVTQQPAAFVATGSEVTAVFVNSHAEPAVTTQSIRTANNLTRIFDLQYCWMVSKEFRFMAEAPLNFVISFSRN